MPKRRFLERLKRPCKYCEEMFEPSYIHRNVCPDCRELRRCGYSVEETIKIRKKAKGEKENVA